MTTKKPKKQDRVLRLMARLTLLNEARPTDAFQLKIWTQQRETIMRQLKKHGIETE